MKKNIYNIMNNYISLGFPGGSDGKESAYNAGDLGSFLGLGRSPGEMNGNTMQFLLGESHGQRSLGSYSPWGHKESDTAEATLHTHIPEANTL